MEQKPIREYNGQTYSIEEGAELIKELDDRTRHDEDGYNSIAELAGHAKTEIIRAWATPPDEDVEEDTDYYIFTTTSAFELKTVQITAKEAPTGAALVASITKNGTPVATTHTPIQLGIGERVSAIFSYADTTTFVVGDVLGLIITQIGSTKAGAGIITKITIKKT